MKTYYARRQGSKEEEEEEEEEKGREGKGRSLLSIYALFNLG